MVDLCYVEFCYAKSLKLVSGASKGADTWLMTGRREKQSWAPQCLEGVVLSSWSEMWSFVPYSPQNYARSVSGTLSEVTSISYLTLSP